MYRLPGMFRYHGQFHMLDLIHLCYVLAGRILGQEIGEINISKTSMCWNQLQ